MKLKKLATQIAVATSFAVSGSALAAPTYFSPLTLFEDDLIDFHIDRDGDGLISVGDSVISIVEVFSTAPVLGGGSEVNIAPPEFTGILDAYVTSVSPSGVPGLFNFSFGANPGGFLAGSGLGAIPLAQATAGALGGEIVRFWNGPLDNLDLVGVNCTTFDDCATRASDGTFYFSFGFNGDEQEHFLILNAPNDPAAVLSQAATANLGSANFAASIIDNQSGVNFLLQDCSTVFCPGGGDGKIEVVGSGQINGGQGLVNGAFARGDFQFQMAVPEPASLALVGLGLLGLGATTARRKLKA